MAGAISSTGRKDYCTPEWILEPVRGFFRALRPNEHLAGIDLDPCSNPSSSAAAATNVMLEEVPESLLGWQTNCRFGSDGDCHTWNSDYVKGDGLKVSWAGARVYCNPPFGSDKITKVGLRDWIKKGLEAGTEAIFCVPDTAETDLWKNTILLKARGRCQLLRRVIFVGMKSCIPKQISLVYFGSNPALFKAHFRTLGRVEDPSEVYADQADLVL